MRRFVFDAKKLQELKERVISNSGVKNPTRVELVTALIYRCALLSNRANSNPPRPAVVLQAINLRKRMNPQLTENSAGNLSWSSMVLVDVDKEPGLNWLVGQYREDLEETCKSLARKQNGTDAVLAFFEVMD
ncbi:hypothetical protein RJ641_012862 [Dillenia turbinata]|uniref:Uncharacterized protein n=1 Tax=Dillenia turbinata TaxID=194707 RepID=A0AAN8UUY5_9MAGN